MKHTFCALFLVVACIGSKVNAKDLNGGVQIYNLRSSDVTTRSWDGDGTEKGLQETWDISRKDNDDIILTPPDNNDIVIIPADGRVFVRENVNANAEIIEFRGDILGVNGNASLELDPGSTLSARKIIARGDRDERDKSRILVKNAELKVSEEISAEFADIELRGGLVETQTLSLQRRSTVEKDGGEFKVKDIRIDESSIKGLSQPVENIIGNGVIIEKIEVEQSTDPFDPDLGNIGSLLFDSIVYGPNSRALFDISGLTGGILYDQVISNNLDYGGNELVLNMQQGPFSYPSESTFSLFVSNIYAGLPLQISLYAQGSSYEGLNFLRVNDSIFETGVTPYNQFLLFEVDTGKLYVKEVPGPLPILGLGFFMSYARKIKNRLKRIKESE